jgi:hypothetical protein
MGMPNKKKRLLNQPKNLSKKGRKLQQRANQQSLEFDYKNAVKLREGSRHQM